MLPRRHLGCSMVSSSTDPLSGKDNPFQDMMSRILFQLKGTNGAMSLHMSYEENVCVIEQKGNASANIK